MAFDRRKAANLNDVSVVHWSCATLDVVLCSTNDFKAREGLLKIFIAASMIPVLVRRQDVCCFRDTVRIHKVDDLARLCNVDEETGLLVAILVHVVAVVVLEVRDGADGE